MYINNCIILYIFIYLIEYKYYITIKLEKNFKTKIFICGCKKI